MEHPSYNTDSDSGAFSKIVAAVVVALVLCAAGAYVVFGSGMWNPPPQHTGY